MTKKHAKSPCCDEKIIRFGGKRRQCVRCKKTWRLRPKRRGRKAILHKGKIIERLLSSRRSREESGNERAKHLARLRKDRDVFNKKELWILAPKGPLIIIADAIVRYYQGKWHTWYFVLVRAVSGEDAVILPPHHLEGKETPLGWKETMSAISLKTLNRVKALVSDGHLGLMLIAKERGWKISRCHFHLLRAIGARRSKRSMGRHRDEALLLNELAKCVLEEVNKKKVALALTRIKEIAGTTTSKILKKVLMGFLKSAPDYRTYLEHPELKLPTTSNTAESLNALIGDLTFRARGFRSIASLSAWINALCKERKIIKCRGKYQPN